MVRDTWLDNRTVIFGVLANYWLWKCKCNIFLVDNKLTTTILPFNKSAKHITTKIFDGVGKSHQKNFFSVRSSPESPIFKKLQSDPVLIRAHVRCPSEISGLWNFLVRVQSWSDKIESDPVLIRKIFENHQSDPVLIRQCKIIHFSFASWGKRTAGAIFPWFKYDWLKAK